MVLKEIICPHCRAEQTIDTHWIKQAWDMIYCVNCGNSFAVHMWTVKRKEIWSVS